MTAHHCFLIQTFQIMEPLMKPPYAQAAPSAQPSAKAKARKKKEAAAAEAEASAEPEEQQEADEQEEQADSLEVRKMHSES